MLAWVHVTCRRSDVRSRVEPLPACNSTGKRYDIDACCADAEPWLHAVIEAGTGRYDARNCSCRSGLSGSESANRNKLLRT